MTLTPDARELWWHTYPQLTQPADGLLGQLTARAEAHVIRLALIYTLLDGQRSSQASPPSARVLGLRQPLRRLGARTNAGDPLAEQIHAALSHAHPTGSPAPKSATSATQPPRRPLEQALAALAHDGKVTEPPRPHQRAASRALDRHPQLTATGCARSATLHQPISERSGTVNERPGRAERSEPRSGALDSHREAKLPPLNVSTFARPTSIVRPFATPHHHAACRHDHHPRCPSTPPRHPRANDESIRARLRGALEENKQLRAENAQLRDELALAHGEIRELKLATRCGDRP